MSKSVAVTLIFDYFASIRMFDRIGMVVFFSIIPQAWLKGFKIKSLFMVNSIII